MNLALNVEVGVVHEIPLIVGGAPVSMGHERGVTLTLTTSEQRHGLDRERPSVYA